MLRNTQVYKTRFPWPSMFTDIYAKLLSSGKILFNASAM